MNLGITGKTALICASSQGLGLACAQSLAREGVKVILNGRNEEKLAEAELKIQQLEKNATGEFKLKPLELSET